MNLKLTAILLTASFLISCSSIGSQARLPLPPPIDYPKVSLEEVECLPDEVKKKILKRDRLKTARIKALTNTIRKTH